MFWCKSDRIKQVKINFFCHQIKVFFISNTLVSNGRVKFVKNQANAKEHPEAELLLFENYLHSSSTLTSKNNSTSYSKK